MTEKEFLEEVLDVTRFELKEIDKKDESAGQKSMDILSLFAIVITKLEERLEKFE